MSISNTLPTSLVFVSLIFCSIMNFFFLFDGGSVMLCMGSVMLCMGHV